MAETTMKQIRIIATIEKCRIPCVEIPIQEKTPEAQPYLESGGAKGESTLVSTQKTTTSCLEYRYKRRFTPPSPIWKVAARKVNLLWYRHRKLQRTAWSTDTREDSRHPALSGKWWRER